MAGSLDPTPGGADVNALTRQPHPRLRTELMDRRLVAGQYADGTSLWLSTARAIETHVGPRIRIAAADVGRSAPRIVGGLPVAVHDDVTQARAAAAERYAGHDRLPDYQPFFVSLTAGESAGWPTQ